MQGILHPNHFYVIAVISNPVRYLSRERLFRKFEAEMKAAGAKLLIVELAYGHRPWVITESGNPMHLQIRTQSEIWHKENMVNLGVKRLSDVCPDWSSFAFIDGDVSFARSHWISERQDWIAETVHQLQHYQVVQMFQTALDLGPEGETFSKYQGFSWAYVQGRFKPNTTKYTSYHPGYAWAWRRDAFNSLGGLIDTALLGAGDRHMAYGLVSMMQESIHPGLNPNYATGLLEWQKRADRYIQHNIGYLPGTLVHHFHGKKANRAYHERWKILVRNQYDPNTDIIRGDQGVLELVVMNSRQMTLRDDVRAYFRQRNEDDISVDAEQA